MNLPRCDLHLHTYYSDGRASPEDVVRQSAHIGLACIAITDHDNTRGFAEAAPVAAELGISLLPGIELTTRWDRCLQASASKTPASVDLDLLGYCFDPAYPAFNTMESAALADLHKRIAELCQLFSLDGISVSLEDALMVNPRYAGAMQLIDSLRRRGYAASVDEALQLFNQNWPRVRPGRLSIEEAITVIHAAGGVAVLAHPTVINCGNGWLGEAEISGLVEMGLDGLEVQHHKLNRAARRHFENLARRFGLLATGGSDEHGWPQGFPRLGSQPIGPGTVRAIQLRAKRYRG